MLVVISDLHLTDKTSGEVIDDKAFRIFRNRVGDMAYDASWRIPADKSITNPRDYQPLEELNILLLGDIIDMIRSEKWNDLEEIDMPWTETRGDSFFETISGIVDAVLSENRISFSLLKDMAEQGIKIPRTMRVLSETEKIDTKLGSIASEEKATVKVNIYYMVGNHDWFLYIKDPRMNSIRNRIIASLGLANEKDKPFPYFPDEDQDLERIQTDHNVYALHGDLFDNTNFQPPTRDVSSVGDVVVLKLLNEIPKLIEQQLKKFPPDQIGKITDIKTFVNELREIDNLRPYSLAPHWIAHVINKYGLNPSLVNDSIRDALHKLINNFISNPLVSRNHFTVIKMEVAELLFKTHLSITDLASLIQFLSLDKDSIESYRDYARGLTTKDLAKGKSFYVMGHTHYPELIPMSSITSDDETAGQIYINTGTWRTLHKTGLYDGSFISYKTMTMAAFFKGNERRGHNFECWTGLLDL
jgi:UDP-2,3-diacylglucosamine pyrophosphatase LpxH